MCYGNCQVMGTYLLIKSMANEQRGERKYLHTSGYGSIK